MFVLGRCADKNYFGRIKGVLVCEFELEREHFALIETSSRSFKSDVPYRLIRVHDFQFEHVSMICFDVDLFTLNSS